MKALVALLLGIGLFVAGFQLREYIIMEQAASKAKQDIRNAFNIGFVAGKNKEGISGSYWPRDAKIPTDVQRNFPTKGSDIEISMGTYPDQVLLFCRPIYGRDLLVVLYDNGAVGKLTGSLPPFVED